MMELIKDLPANVVGVRASGEVTKQDLETVLIPNIDALVERHGHIHYLLQLDTSVKNWDFGAWFSDLKAGLKHPLSWKKMAIVSDEEGVRKFTDAVSLFVPGGQAKGYTLAQLDEAKAWVGTES